MPTFPALVDGDGNTITPSTHGFAKRGLEDPTNKGVLTDGNRGTGVIVPYTPTITTALYEDINQTSQDALETFEETTVQYGSTVFDWTDPTDSTVYAVVFSVPIVYMYESNSGKWNALITVELSDVDL